MAEDDRLVALGSAGKSRGGRPKKAPEDLRSRTISLRLTDREWSRLVRRARERKTTARGLLRDLALGELPPARLTQTDGEMVGQLRRVGTNLNQALLAFREHGKHQLLETRIEELHRLLLEVAVALKGGAS